MKVLQKVNFQNYVNRIYSDFFSLIKEVRHSREHPYEIAGWIKKESREKDILVYRITATDKYINSFSVMEIYSDDSVLMNFSKQEIKYISTLAILLHYKKEPKYKLIWQNFRSQLGDGIVHLSDRDKLGIVKAKIRDLEKNIALIDGLNGREAFILGKEVGISERLHEQEVIDSIHNDF